MENKNAIQVKIDAANEQGNYTNAVSVHTSPTELAVDFGYLLPASNPTTIKVVSRVTMTHSTAESLVKVLTESLENVKTK
jgi:hypothetical protein